MSLSADPNTPHAYLITLICGGIMTQALHMTAELGLADLVKDGPCTTEELVKATGTDTTNLARLLRALVSLDLLTEPTAGRYGATPFSAYLESEREGSLYPMALMAGSRWQWNVLGALHHSLLSGTPATSQVLGKTLWQYFVEDDPEAGRRFNQAINNSVGLSDLPIANSYDFSQVGTLVDVGGGIGSFLLTVLPRYPHLKGVLFDRAEVTAQAKEPMAKAGLSSRCELVAGDFFESVPSGGDLYFLRQIIKDWDDAQSATILQQCVRAMNPGGRILVAEQVLQPGKADLVGKLTDLQLMTTLAGRERDEQEFGRLVGGAGLTLLRTIETPSVYSLLEVGA